MVNAGAGLNACLVIEIFAGTGRVTACLKQFGMKSAFGTDHVRHKQAMSQIALADLTSKAGIELLMQWLSNPQVVGLFLAPPCGSASRARAIPLKRKGPGDPPAPKPLRSDRHPNGIPGIRLADREKISRANKLYFLTAKLVQWAHDEGCLICIENPQFSFFWQTTFMQSVLPLLKFTIFQTCRYGSKRAKRTMLAFNADEFSVINKMCLGQTATHRHQKWGVSGPHQQFATAMETAYPMPLARAIASAFILALHNRGICLPPETMADLQDTDGALLPALRAQTGLQSKASKLPPLIPLFAAKVALTGFQSDLPKQELQQKLTAPLQVQSFNAPTLLPKASKLLQICPSLLPDSCLQGGVFASGQQLQQDEIDRIVSMCSSEALTKSGKSETQVWGVPWSEMDFAEQMVKFGHPATLEAVLPTVLREAVDRYKTMDAQQRVSYRASRLGFWLKRLVELRSEEKALKEAMHPDVALVLGQKNILLWQAMLQSVQYPDMGVVEEFKMGTELVGCAQPTGLWPAKFQPAVITVKELCHTASMERGAIGEQFRGSGAGEFADEVWSKTLDEVSSGTLIGPIPLTKIDNDTPLSRRFGIQQGPKIRCIDDFSRSSVNSAVQTMESPKPHTVDVFAALCVSAMSQLRETGDWVGRTFDLIGAYRQCAIHPDSQKFAHIVAQDPRSSQLFAFRMRALPFGAIKSVHSFLRVSHSIWYILVKEFMILSTNYFDDFVAIATSDESQAVQSCVHMFLKMLGWLFAETGEKAPSFSGVFQALGVSVDVRSMGDGLVKIGNTENRRRELIKTINAALENNKLSKADALRLRGRLQFASGNVFGRIAKSALAAVTTHAYHSTSASLDDRTQLALAMHERLLTEGRPRELRPKCCTTWYVQTDACYEKAEDEAFSGIGAVLFTPRGEPIRFFSNRLSAELLAKLNPADKKTAIFECEFFALLCAFITWGDMIEGAAVFYTDNNAVRDALIACSSSNLIARRQLVSVLALECIHQITPWYARVPTDSNLADKPSRLDTSQLVQLGAMQDQLDLMSCWSRHAALADQWGDDQAACRAQLEKA